MVKSRFFAIIALSVAVMSCVQAAPSPQVPTLAAGAALHNALAADIRGLYVSGDGSCYAYSSLGLVDIYRPGKPVESAQTDQVAPDGVAICGNSKYVFITCKNRSGSTNGIFRLGLGGRAAPYQVPDADNRPTNRYFLSIGRTDIAAIGAGDAALCVSSPAENVVRLFDPATMAPMGWFELAHPGHVTVDGAGHIWVEQIGSSTLLSYDTSGNRLSQTITLPVGCKVQALACDTAHNTLLVADNGPDQNVKLFDLANPTAPATTIGRTGGIYAKRAGQASGVKLNGPCGVGLDNLGNVYVASCGAGMDTVPSFQDGATLTCFTSSGQLRWKYLSLVTDGNADFDPLIPTDIYTTDRHILYNYATRTGSPWSYNGYTLDRFRFPDDPRLVFASSPKKVWIRHINKGPYLFIAGKRGDFLAVYRFNKGGRDGETAIPAVEIVQQQGGSRIATDKNGIGHFEPNSFAPLPDVDLRDSLVAIDTLGGVWIARPASLTHLEISEFDEAGVPHYGAAETFAMPPQAGFSHIDSLVYDPSIDSLFLTAKREARVVVARIDAVSKGARRVAWIQPLRPPLDPRAPAVIARVTASGQVLLFAAGAPEVGDDGQQVSGKVRLLALDARTGAPAAQAARGVLLPSAPGDLQALRLTRMHHDELSILDSRLPEQLTLCRFPATALTGESEEPR